MADVEKVIKQIDSEIQIARMVNKDYTTVDLSLLEDVLRVIKAQRQMYWNLEHDWRMLRKELATQTNAQKSALDVR